MKDFSSTLQKNGFRITAGRLALLSVLWREKEPLTVAEIRRRLHNKLDTVTLYRALEALAAKGVIRRVDLAHGHAHYELQKKHHHHLVCTSCGMIEDVEHCGVEALSKHALHSSKKFKSITTHELELYGLCASCTP